jgi:uroporphyrin-III C-methyltransferase
VSAAAGTVYLVGAGPGDPGLLTLRGAELLATCDDVVVDALANPQLLSHCRAGVQRHDVGKRAGQHSATQAGINELLIRLARENRSVVRLKGGDPFVFGRGGEEALALAAAKIPFRVVPGITAAIAGLAYAGIPATHRDINSAVTFITGHASDGEVPDGLDWAALAKGAPTLVIYMALKHLDTIARRLMAAGRPPDEPVAVVSKATTPAQRVLVTTLGRAAAETAAAGIEPPAIVAIGPAVRLRQSLDWLAK